MSYAVDFVQAETQLFSGGPCHALWCEPEHYVKIIQLLDENFGRIHQWVSPFGRTRLRFRKVCQLLSRTSILTHVSSSILRRLRLTALTTRYSVSDVVRLQVSNFQGLHHLSIHKCIATSRLVKVCTLLITLILPLVDLPPKSK